MSHRVWLGSVLVVAVALAMTAGAAPQGGGKPARGNPTPGTTQPDPPHLADRITLTGCVQAAPGRSTSAIDNNTPSASRFILTNAERRGIPPTGTGGSDLATTASAPGYRLEAIETQLSPFVGAKVELSGEIKPQRAESGSSGKDLPTIQVEFVQKLAASCS